MNFKEFIKEHSSELLLGIGITGIGITGYLSAKGALKAERLIKEKKPETLKEKVVLAAKSYGPAVGAGVITAACFVGAHEIDIDKVAAATTASAIAEATLDSYKRSFAQRLTQQQAKEIDEEVEKDLKSRNIPVKNPGLMFAATYDTKYLFTDEFAGVNFEMTFCDLDMALNEFNNRMNHEGYADLEDWYMVLNGYGAGIDIPKMAATVGWSASNALLDYTPESKIVDKRVIITIQYNVDPISDYKERY